MLRASACSGGDDGGEVLGDPGFESGTFRALDSGRYDAACCDGPSCEWTRNVIIEAWTIDGVVQVREYDVDTGTCDSPFVVGEMVDGRVDVTYREAEDGVYSEGGVYFADCSERFESRLLGG